MKIALDELRTLMLGSQVLFGFQFNVLFQDGFTSLSRSEINAAALGFVMILVTLGLLIAAPAFYRLTEEGRTSTHAHAFAHRCSEYALVALAAALAADVFLICDKQWGEVTAWTAALLTLAGCALAWFGVGLYVRRRLGIERSSPMKDEDASPSSLHAKIDCLLTEARVILPGAQALLGFALLVTFTKTFDELPAAARNVHFVSLALVTLAVLLLIAPAAIHRHAFGGRDDRRFLPIGSAVITVALVPFALGIAAEMYVATIKLYEEPSLAWTVAGVALALLLTLWYFLPLLMRR